MKKSTIIAIIGGVLIVGGVVTYLSVNYYSTLADVREAAINVDTSDAYTYGEMLFTTRGCAFCHTLEAAGADGDAGPDLSQIGARADADAIRQSIIDPNAVIASECPEGPCEAGIMPEFGTVLDESQIEALVTYLSAQQ